MEKAKVDVHERFSEYLSMYGNEVFIPMLDGKDKCKMAQGKKIINYDNIWICEETVSVNMNSMVHS